MLEALGTLDTAVGTVGAFADVASTGGVVSTGGGATAPGLMGGLGLALSGYGLGESIHDISKNGATGENVSNGFFSAVGLGSGVASLAGGTAAAFAAPLLTSLATGGVMGNAGSSYAKRKGYAGKGADGENRNYSEMAADWGVAAKEYGGDGLFGDVLGVGATFGGSLYGTVGSMLNMPSIGIDAVTDLVTGPSPIQQVDDYIRPTTGDMVKNFGNPSNLDLVQRMQGQGALAQQAAGGGKK